ncbi:unnamed protein product [Pleuronectes platessa]|uniref:Uncharacterized protein n=1 Tax=Pleuronectes platessa TaxID=8262 RepID=A0A9N7Y8N2_PLEPL|nr:unnamed protein product [Pleuronectes platessa]
MTKEVDLVMRTAGHVPRLGAVAPLPSSPRCRRLSVRHREVLIRWHLTASLVGGLSFSWYAGRCPSPARKAGRWRGLGKRSAAATLDACRALLADHLSYGDRWGNPLFARGVGTLREGRGGQELCNTVRATQNEEMEQRMPQSPAHPQRHLSPPVWLVIATVGRLNLPTVLYNDEC